MTKQKLIRSLACMALGGVLGLAAARGAASPPMRAVTPAACCWEGNSRAQLLATVPAENAEFNAQAEIKKTPAVTAQKKAADSGKKPNILVIWGDDIGTANISAYSSGLMGYETPNIDRIARE